MDDQLELVDEVPSHERPYQLAAAEDGEVILAVLLELCDGIAASPLSSVEFFHGSGSFSVVEATYFCVLSSTSVNGLSVRPGQTLKICS